MSAFKRNRKKEIKILKHALEELLCYQEEFFVATENLLKNLDETRITQKYTIDFKNFSALILKY